MRLLADENVRGDVVEALRTAGYDIAWVLEDHPGAGDAEVLARSADDDRLLLTFDKGDFGMLVFAQGRPVGGVILFRVSAPSPEALADKVVSILESRQDWPGHFWTISNATIRRRKLP